MNQGQINIKDVEKCNVLKWALLVFKCWWWSKRASVTLDESCLNVFHTCSQETLAMDVSSVIQRHLLTWFMKYLCQVCKCKRLFEMNPLLTEIYKNVFEKTIISQTVDHSTTRRRVRWVDNALVPDFCPVLSPSSTRAGNKHNKK